MIDPHDESISKHGRAAPSGWVYEYVLDELPESDREWFEEHLFDCPQCSDKVRTAYLLVRGAETTLQRNLIRPGQALDNTRSPKKVVPLSRRTGQTRFKPALVAAAVMLAVVGGYQNLHQIPALRVQADLANTAVSAPILLLSETRSAADRPSAPAGAGYVALILPNNPGENPAFHECLLRDASGKVAQQFRVKGIPDVDEWELRLPTKGLAPMLYTLEVRSILDANGADSGVSRYQFRLKGRKAERQ